MMIRSKKSKLFTCVFVAFLFCFSFSVSADEQIIRVILDGEELEFDVSPKIINGSTMVPMRAIFEALGSDVSWDGATKTAIGVKDDTTVKITIGSKTMLKNNNSVTLNSPAVIIGGNTLVPTRAIAESFGCDVNWDGETRTVYIYSANADEGMQNDGIQEDTGTQDDYGEPGDIPDEQFD